MGSGEPPMSYMSCMAYSDPGGYNLARSYPLLYDRMRLGTLSSQQDLPKTTD